MKTQILVHPRDKENNIPNFRAQCPRCAKWKRFYSEKDGKVEYNFCNLDEIQIEDYTYETLCYKCYDKLFVN